MGGVPTSFGTFSSALGERTHSGKSELNQLYLASLNLLMLFELSWCDCILLYTHLFPLFPFSHFVGLTYNQLT